MPFAAGQSGSPDKIFQVGNPGGPGAPKGKRLTTILEEILDRKIKKGDVEVTNAEAIALEFVVAARNGDIRAIEGIFDRVEGKPVQPIEMADNRLEVYDKGDDPNVLTQGDDSTIPSE